MAKPIAIKLGYTAAELRRLAASRRTRTRADGFCRWLRCWTA